MLNKIYLTIYANIMQILLKDKKMKKFLLLGAVCSMLSADVKTIPVTPDVIKNYDQIVDIRTPSEWQDTGIIAGAKTITFDPSRKAAFFGEL